MNYRELVERLKCPQIRECPIKEKQPSCGKCQKDINKKAADAITDLLKYKDAIDRMGRFGTMFVQYSGDPRGMIGEIGDVESGNVIERAKDMVMHYGMIVDVDMNVWRPVLEDRLQFLIRCMTERAEAAEARCETLEKMVKEYQDVIVPGYRERAEKAEREAKEAQREATLCRNGWKRAESERDAAVSDIETILAYGDVNLDTCKYCKNGQCYARGGTKPCFPKWRGETEE